MIYVTGDTRGDIDIRKLSERSYPGAQPNIPQDGGPDAAQRARA